MFFDSPSQLPNLASKANFSIFSLDSLKAKQELKKSFKASVVFLEPDEKSRKINVEMIRDFTTLTNTKDTKDRFFVVLNAETMNEPAENAFLKNLEEPKPHHHFVLVTKNPSALLPTVLSRAQIYYLKEVKDLMAPVEASETVKTLAKRLISADAKELITLSNELSKKKDNARNFSLEVVGAAIEIVYKSYFLTHQEKFLKKLTRLLALYDNLERNGHIKLHIVADML